MKLLRLLPNKGEEPNLGHPLPWRGFRPKVSKKSLAIPTHRREQRPFPNPRKNVSSYQKVVIKVFFAFQRLVVIGGWLVEGGYWVSGENPASIWDQSSWKGWRRDRRPSTFMDWTSCYVRRPSGQIFSFHPPSHNISIAKPWLTLLVNEFWGSKRVKVGSMLLVNCIGKEKGALVGGEQTSCCGQDCGGVSPHRKKAKWIKVMEQVLKRRMRESESEFFGPIPKWKNNKVELTTSSSWSMSDQLEHIRGNKLFLHQACSRQWAVCPYPIVPNVCKCVGQFRFAITDKENWWSQAFLIVSGHRVPIIPGPFACESAWQMFLFFDCDSRSSFGIFGTSSRSSQVKRLSCQWWLDATIHILLLGREWMWNKKNGKRFRFLLRSWRLHARACVRASLPFCNRFVRSFGRQVPLHSSCKLERKLKSPFWPAHFKNTHETLKTKRNTRKVEAIEKIICVGRRGAEVFTSSFHLIHGDGLGKWFLPEELLWSEKRGYNLNNGH